MFTQNIHPATLLLINMCLILVLVMPLIAWFTIVRGQGDTAARLWYGGMALTGVGSLAVAVLQRASAFTGICVTLTILLCIAAMRWELQRPLMLPRRVLVPYGVFVMMAIAIDSQGLWQRWGVMLLTATLTILEGYLLFLLVRVGRQFQSRGLLLVGSGVVVVMTTNAARAIHTMLAGGAAPIFSHTVSSNAAILSVMLAAVFFTMGYAAFTQEKAHLRHVADTDRAARAEEQTRLADAHAQELQAIIAQRDEMIVVNSRFSAVSSLAMYNSAIVHEISQPAQALTSILDSLSLRPLDENVKSRWSKPVPCWARWPTRCTPFAA